VLCFSPHHWWKSTLQTLERHPPQPSEPLGVQLLARSCSHRKHQLQWGSPNWGWSTFLANDIRWMQNLQLRSQSQGLRKISKSCSEGTIWYCAFAGCHALWHRQTCQRALRKVEASMAVTDSGMIKLVKELQLLKAPAPMAVIDSGIAKLVKELQPAKALVPMVVRDCERVNLVKELQSWKAE